MKRFIWFIFGLIIGIVGTIIFSYYINGNVGKDYEMNFFEQPGQVMESDSYWVIQAWPNGTALAMDEEMDDLLTVLLWNKEHKQYYDQQVISADKNQEFRQVGLCRYKTANEQLGFKTVPIVELVDKHGKE